MKLTHRLVFTLLVLAALLVPTFAVLAKELGQLTISGPGIKGELILDDPAELDSLWNAGIIDTNGFAKAPENLGQGYTITAHMIIENNELLPVVQMVYYPAEEGQQGYIHIVQRLNNGPAMSPADEWSVMATGTDQALRKVLRNHGVELVAAFTVAAAAPVVAAEDPATSGEPAAQPAQSSAPAAPAVSSTVVWLVIAATVGAMLVLGRKSLLRRTA